MIPTAALACESTPEGRSSLLELNRASGYGLETRVDTAISALVAAVETQPAVATNYLDLARCYYTLRRRSDAVVALARGLELVRKARATDQRESSGGTSATAPAAEAPARIKDVSPDYPDDAARTRVTGMVIVQASIDGTVCTQCAGHPVGTHARRCGAPSGEAVAVRAENG